MKMKRLFLLSTLACCLLSAAATDRLFIEDFAIARGKTVVMPLVLTNEAQYTAFQADVYLPEQLSVDSDNGVYGFALTERKGNHVLSVNRLPDGGIRLLSYSVDLEPYNGNNGVLVTVPVTASDDFADTAIIELKNVLFTTLDAVEVRLPDHSCTVTAVIPLLGDVDDDGTVAIADLSALIDYLLGVEVFPFNAANADVDGDGVIAFGDVSELIDLLRSTLLASLP